jgi:hypothetical protein
MFNGLKINPKNISMFQGRKLVITTKHGKAEVMSEILKNLLGIEVVVNDIFDTDSLGTFTGEVERTLTPLETVRRKCILGMEAFNMDLGIANEGSFGPHPGFPFIPVNEEFIILIDKKNDLEIVVKDITTETNFNAQEVISEDELRVFMKQANFPSHALILSPSKENKSEVYKGITDEVELLEIFQKLVGIYGKTYVETDMRAHKNPMRMQFIGQLTKKLIEKVLFKCPVCDWPGFGRSEPIYGLPCQHCGTPTRTVLSYLCSCQKCGVVKEETFPEGKTHEDPMYCDYCNP